MLSQHGGCQGPTLIKEAGALELLFCCFRSTCTLSPHPPICKLDCTFVFPEYGDDLGYCGKRHQQPLLAGDSQRQVRILMSGVHQRDRRSEHCKSGTRPIRSRYGRQGSRDGALTRSRSQPPFLDLDLTTHPHPPSSTHPRNTPTQTLSHQPIVRLRPCCHPLRVSST